MTVLDFPNEPYDGQTFVGPNSVVYRWNAAGGLWLTAGMGSNQAIIGVRPPSNATDGQLWFSTVLGQLFVFFDDGSSQQWVPASPATTPPGTINDYAGVSVPGGWYLCDGSIKGRIDDEPLFLAIGTTFGDGDGETTFQLPDLRGRVIAMVDGGSGVLSGWNTFGDVGGAAMHTLTVTEMPPHGHGVSDPHHSHAAQGAPGTPFATINSGSAYWTSFYTGDIPLYYANGTAYSPTGISIVSAGGGEAHANVQPTMVLNKIIKR